MTLRTMRASITPWRRRMHWSWTPSTGSLAMDERFTGCREPSEACSITHELLRTWGDGPLAWPTSSLVSETALLPASPCDSHSSTLASFASRLGCEDCHGSPPRSKSSGTSLISRSACDAWRASFALVVASSKFSRAYAADAQAVESAPRQAGAVALMSSFSMEGSCEGQPLQSCSPWSPIIPGWPVHAAAWSAPIKPGVGTPPSTGQAE
mmetsp:Transcript_22052/g.65755  ORF Transcript_22052/g.65755 Transcript_22052/m.65755 type:complete len:210 (-) Transcript_22052:2198-2827(-)